MKIVYQRVKRAAVHIDGSVYSEIDNGVLLLLAIDAGDTEEMLQWGARKCINLRAFEDDENKMNRSLAEVQGQALVVSQFTLSGDVRKGRRPSFDKAESPEKAEIMYELFCGMLRAFGVPVKTGQFGATMDVESINAGPVTFIIEKDGNG